MFWREPEITSQIGIMKGIIKALVFFYSTHLVTTTYYKIKVDYLLNVGVDAIYSVQAKESFTIITLC